MKALKLRRPALVALLAVVLVAVGVLVWPTPKEAWATDWQVRLELDWNEFTPRDVHATAQLLTAAMVPIGNPVALTPNSEWSVWEADLADGGATPSFVRFDWDYKAGNQLDPDWDSNWWIVGDGMHNPDVVVEANTTGTLLQMQKFWG